MPVLAFWICKFIKTLLHTWTPPPLRTRVYFVNRTAHLPLVDRFFRCHFLFYWSVTRMVPLWKNLTHLSIQKSVTGVITITWFKLLQQGGIMDTRKTLLLFLAGEYFYNFIFSLKDGFVICLWYFILMFSDLSRFGLCSACTESQVGTCIIVSSSNTCFSGT